MKTLFGYADQYVQKSTWKDLALIKICLCAVGILIGLAVAEDKKKSAAAGAFALFAITYVPLMAKFFGIIKADVKG